MELHLKRTERRGIFGVVYQVHARLILTPEEKQEVKKQRLNEQVIFDGRAHPVSMVNFITVDSLQHGEVLESRKVSHITYAEEQIKLRCTNLKSFFDVGASFDGEERIIDFD